jgi:hypothetical protein
MLSRKCRPILFRSSRAHPRRGTGHRINPPFDGDTGDAVLPVQPTFAASLNTRPVLGTQRRRSGWKEVMSPHVCVFQSRSAAYRNTPLPIGKKDKHRGRCATSVLVGGGRSVPSDHYGHSGGRERGGWTIASARSGATQAGRPIMRPC